MASESVIRISSKAIHSTYLPSAKSHLQAHSEVQLHGLGEAITNTVRLAETLTSIGYAKLKKFETQTLTEEDEGGRQRKRAKVVITMEKTPDFERLVQEYEKSRGGKRS